MMTRQELLEELGKTIETLNIQRITAGYTDEDRTEFKRQVDAGQQRYFTLMVQEFNAGTAEYEEAGEAMKKVIADMAQGLQELENLVTFFSNLTKLFASIDKIIQTGAKIVSPL